MQSGDAGYMMLIMVFGLPIFLLAVTSYIESIPEQLSEWRLQAKMKEIEKSYGSDD